MSDPCPLQEAEATCHQLAGVVFPWDLTRSFELALLKTFCGPSISALLDRTGEFAQRPRKRFHGHYTIGNDDFRYVLSTFVAEPIHWLSRSTG